MLLGHIMQPLSGSRNAKVQAGQIHRGPHHRKPPLQPVRQMGANPAQDDPIQVHHRSVSLHNGKEGVRIDNTAIRRTTARQCFGPNDLAGIQIHLGL